MIRILIEDIRYCMFDVMASITTTR